MKLSLICPECHQTAAYENSAPGGTVTCPRCHRWFQLDGQGRPQRIPVAEAVAVDESSTGAFLEFLDVLETMGKRMNEGAVRFLIDGLPQWLARQMANLGRIAVKATRVLAVFSLWFALTCLPLALLMAGPSWFPRGIVAVLFVLAWTALALIGSLWGVKHARGQWPARWWRFRRPKAQLR